MLGTRILSVCLLLACVLFVAVAPIAADEGPALSTGNTLDAMGSDEFGIDADEDSADEDSADEDSADEDSADAKPLTDRLEEDADEPEEEALEMSADEELEAAAEPETRTPPSKEMLALRDQIRRVLEAVQRRPFNTRDNTAVEMIYASLPLGCESEVRIGSPSGEKINGITCLCWNYPCAGFELLKPTEDRIVARVGYGLQDSPAHLLALLAQSRVPADYPIRVEQNVRSVSDLVEEEKLDCRAGRPMSSGLIALSYYLPAGEKWQSRTGDDWSIEKMVEEELSQAAAKGTAIETHGLTALSHALARRVRNKNPIQGEFLRARKYVAEFQDHALSLQNPDGSWHPGFFAYRGSDGTPAERLYSTGHILEWLAFSLPEARLEDPRVVKAVAYVAALAGNRRYGWDVTSMNTRNIAGLMHALHGLAIYNERVFTPWDPNEPDPETEKVAEVR